MKIRPFEGQVAAITGAASGIGLACAKRLLAAAPVPNPIEQRKRREERHALLESLGDRVVELDTRELL